MGCPRQHGRATLNQGLAFVAFQFTDEFFDPLLVRCGTYEQGVWSVHHDEALKAFDRDQLVGRPVPYG